MDVDLLQHIFSIAIISHDAARDKVEPAVLPLDYQLGRPVVILARAFNKLALVWLGLRKSIWGISDLPLRFSSTGI